MRRGELAGNLFLPLIGVLGASLWSTPLNIGIVCLCYVFGLAMLARAKYLRVRHGALSSLGPSHLPWESRRAYRIGYTFIAVGIFLNLIVLAILARRHHPI